MALMQKLSLKQGQSLVMTPQLQQAIKLLQMSNLEIQDFVETELERNPLLERTDVGLEGAAAPAESSISPETENSSAVDAKGADGDGADLGSDSAAIAAESSFMPSLESGSRSSPPRFHGSLSARLSGIPRRR